MAGRKRKRGSGGHPARVAERRNRGRARHREAPSDERVLRRTVSATCDEFLRCETALEAELCASQLLGSWWPGDPLLDDDDADLEYGGPLVQELGRRADADALAALTALAEVSDGELGLQAGEHAERLKTEGVPPPRWAEAIQHAEILRTAEMREEVFDDGSTIFIEALHVDGERHAIGVYIDNNIGVMAKDILLADSIDRVGELMRKSPEEAGVLRLEEIDPRETGARILAAMELTDMTLDPPVGEDYARLRALARSRADELPVGTTGIDTPEISAQDRDRLLADFLASPEGRGMAVDSEEADVVSFAIDFTCDYVDGRPLRWSPVVVELFMAGWLPRKVIAESELFEAVPAALEAWVRYAARVRSIPDWAIAQTIAAIPEWQSEMSEPAADPRAAGPAKRFISAAKEAGVDVTDEEAMARFIAGWNARRNAA